MGGTYVTAADMNTGEADLDVIGERTTHVLGRSAACGGSGSSAGATALGVFHGIRASVRHAFGDDDLAGRTVLIQGVGSVGSRLAELLRDAGAQLLLADLDEARGRPWLRALGDGTVPAPHHVLDASATCSRRARSARCLNDDTSRTCGATIVAGAANNQLAEPRHGDDLHARGILYAPDYAINAGGVIHLAGYERLGLDEAQVDARLAGIATR